MKCQGCGHEYASTFPRCSRCGELNPRRMARQTESRLIEFPRKARRDEGREAASNALPTWRKELNEKVRAIKARKNSGESPSADSRSDQPTVSPKAGSEARVPRAEILSASTRPLVPIAPTQTSASPPSGPRSSNAIVEAALTRVRRASENASRASLSRIEPARPVQVQPAPSVSIDRMATARALEVSVETHPRIEIPAPPPVDRTQSPARQHQIPKAREVRPLPVEPEVEDEVKAVDAAAAGDKIVEGLEELEPLDYLQAEINKIDRARAEEFAHNESPSLIVHSVIGLVDLLTIAASSAPFLAVIQIMNGDFGDSRTRLAGALIVLLVSFFYLALTQCLSGKTFGMMATNTRVVEFRSSESPSGMRLLLRTIGYFVALAPATLGMLWIGLNRHRRGWHDLLSGTRVVRDF